MNVFLPADILLPQDVDMEKWAVIACDQFTSDAAYWQRVRRKAGDAPSTIHMILPEAELGQENGQAVNKINTAMRSYLEQGLFQKFAKSYIYVERTLENGMIRKGLVGMVDLESYDYHPGSQSLTRATEQTVLERIPPRKQVRKDAPLEFPHVLMLCDDEKMELIEPVAEAKQGMQVVYDFDLMEDGGHITGYLLSEEEAAAFDARFTRYSETFAEKYDGLDGAKVLLAVGDGNHSLATAKSCYEELKQNNPGVDFSSHPARYALVELENIHDPALSFEPIHRILTGVDGRKLLADIQAVCKPGGFEVTYVMGAEKGILSLDRDLGELAVAVLQNFLDRWLRENGGKIDYIHGDKDLEDLALQPDALGFLLPPMEKYQLFRGVISGGALPRKTFSMGHAREKRYYLEGRSIR